MQRGPLVHRSKHVTKSEYAHRREANHYGRQGAACMSSACKSSIPQSGSELRGSVPAWWEVGDELEWGNVRQN